ncbi:glycerol-3-phosphate dehydrogenase C-terminal domain-containing protein, partial [Micromonospora sp. NPDC049580]|uniref:glycerol-3-phosphate dehydrogenase C-terminal domain-containing protein n=1 Tax=Micromonospora sp. NPDC049580 TaxID=3154832 RepID=UPI00341465CC
HLVDGGAEAPQQVLALLREDPTLGEPLDGAEDYLRVEVVYAASAEGALHLEDVLTRRTHISIESFDRGLMAARPAATLMAPVLGWDDERVDREVAHYVARVRAERAAHEQPDDAAADAFRLDAPDVVPAVAVAT